LLFVYVLAAFLYVFSNAQYPGCIAYIPKWIFLFSVLIFLEKVKMVHKTVEYFLGCLNKTIKRFPKF